MSRFFARLFRLPFHLVLIGVALGMVARAVYPPKTEVIAPRQFTDPIEEFTNLPLVRPDSK